MSTKKGGGSSRNGRDSRGKRLGLKKFGGETVKAGNIWSGSAAPSTIRGSTLASDAITRCSRSRTAS